MTSMADKSRIEKGRTLLRNAIALRKSKSWQARDRGAVEFRRVVKTFQKEGWLGRVRDELLSCPREWLDRIEVSLVEVDITDCPLVSKLLEIEGARVVAALENCDESEADDEVVS